MAARTVFKLLSKTCAYSCQATPYPTNFPSVRENTCVRPPRSCSQPPRRNFDTKQELFFQIRNVSKSLQNLKDVRLREEEYEEEEIKSSSNTFPPVADLSTRDPAKEFKENKHTVEETNDEGNPIYELTEGSRNDENYYDVLNYMKKMEINRSKHMFPHLQPSNLKPYGSSENLYTPHLFQPRAVYQPKRSRTSSQTEVRRRRIDQIQQKDFSTGKVYPAQEETQKIAICESKSATKKYSSTNVKKPKLTVSVRRSSTAFLRKKLNVKKSQEILEQKIESLPQKKSYSSGMALRVVSSKKLLFEKASRNFSQSRKYNTQQKIQDKCADFVTVKLRDLQEECRKEKKCKPKKICFGRLPKLAPPDCPCIEDIPLKEGKPLLRLKKRFDVKERPKVCAKEIECSARADDNYVIKPKTLPAIVPQECPCEEREMTDWVLNRLPKKFVPEPPRICGNCTDPNDIKCCPPRADQGLTIQKKVLPKLKINNCPCIEEPPLKDVPLKKLKRKEIKEPVKECLNHKECDEVLRADYNLKIEKKTLRPIKGDCVCVDPPPMNPGQPLRRLGKFKIPDKPKICPTTSCDETIRADAGKKFGKKKLPVFKPQNCPCIEPHMPSITVNFKRLKPKYEPKDKPRACLKKDDCGPRADDGLVIKPKELPILEAKECPCVEKEMYDVPPLKRLVPNPVKEPEKVCDKKVDCTTPRADDNMRVKKKNLPVLKPGNCPCIEPEPPLDVKPLKKLKAKPIAVKRICPEKEKECAERADENLKIEAKQLPKLQIPDCPCIEQEPPEDVKPLKRLKKVHIPEPPKVCPKLDDCDETPRADEHDWMYWKRVEVKPEECEQPSKSGRRNFSTLSRRYYSTSTRVRSDNFRFSYDDINSLMTNFVKEKSYNVIIDIKPSAPLILTQEPLQKKVDNFNSLSRLSCSSMDYVAFVIHKTNSLGTVKAVKDGSNDVSSNFNTTNRFISTCSSLCEASEGRRDCDCPPKTDHLQPRKPLIPEKEVFIKPYPTDKEIEATARKSLRYYNTRNESETKEEVAQLECSEEQNKVICEEEEMETVKEQKMSMWERVVNYFKAKPCPSPEEFRRLKLKEDAERAALKAGLCLYDPKEMLRKNEKEMPKVITADSGKDECSK